MKHIVFTYRTADATIRQAVAPASHILRLPGHAARDVSLSHAYPIEVAVSDVVRVELVEDEAAGP